LSASQPGTIKVCQRLTSGRELNICRPLPHWVLREKIHGRRGYGKKPFPAEQISKLESTAHAGPLPHGKRRTDLEERTCPKNAGGSERIRRTRRKQAYLKERADPKIGYGTKA